MEAKDVTQAEFNQELWARNRRSTLEVCPRPNQEKMALALDLLIEFSRRCGSLVEIQSTEDLEQESIGCVLRTNGAVLWKIYARRSRLEVLIRTQKELPPLAYAKFARRWRAIPGLAGSLQSKREVAALNVAALSKPHVWAALSACLEWVCKQDWAT